VTPWPQLDYAAWRDTAMTVQLWTQIVGKIRLKLTPWLNHGWHVPLYVTARGLGTSGMPAGDTMIDIEFDFCRPERPMTMIVGIAGSLLAGFVDAQAD
jgi:Family of unknown function (DUF5996)